MTSATSERLEQLAINTIRMLAVDAVQQANSGHPGTPMGAAAMAHVLWTRFLRHNPGDPEWPNRDRFVLSAGHASMLLYSLLYLTGYDLTLDDLRNFRQLNSRTPGHPEYGMTPGVETTTGPLGQGLGNAVGMAIAERWLSERYNRPEQAIIDHYTYVLVSDGDLMEGVASEAASLAGHLKLGKLIVLYDDNKITIDGSTDLSFSEDVAGRFAAYGWGTSRVEDGNDLEALTAAIAKARADTARPTLIAVRTHIGYGSPNKQGTSESHGAPLGADEVRLTKEALGWPNEQFFVPEDALAFYRQASANGAALQSAWEDGLQRYVEEFPKLGSELREAIAGRLPEDWDSELPVFEPDAMGVATRVASGKALNALAARVPNLVGGSADLAGSTNVELFGLGDFGVEPGGRNMHFGVREHGMASIANGMAVHRGVRPFISTFLVFCDYMRPAVRLSALMELPVVYVFTHDSIGLGEDGPTHQPEAHLASLRSIPNLTVIRPADANETVEAWRTALRSEGPVALILTRQALPTMDRSKYAPASELAKGGYVLSDDNGTPEVILIASGSEVPIAVAAADILRGEGRRVRVVNMASWELFEKQPPSYRASVLPPQVRRRVSIEAAATFGWSRYVGDGGVALGMDRFGKSAPGSHVMTDQGFTPERVAELARELPA